MNTILSFWNTILSLYMHTSTCNIIACSLQSCTNHHIDIDFSKETPYTFIDFMSSSQYTHAHMLLNTYILWHCTCILFLLATSSIHDENRTTQLIVMATVYVYMICEIHCYLRHVHATCSVLWVSPTTSAFMKVQKGQRFMICVCIEKFNLPRNDIIHVTDLFNNFQASPE